MSRRERTPVIAQHNAHVVSWFQENKTDQEKPISSARLGAQLIQQKYVYAEEQREQGNKKGRRKIVFGHCKKEGKKARTIQRAQQASAQGRIPNIQKISTCASARRAVKISPRDRSKDVEKRREAEQSAGATWPCAISFPFSFFLLLHVNG
jgi:hypothetical protein